MHSCLTSIGCINGRSPSGSIVNTLLKKLARTSAFSLSVVVFLSSPSSDFNPKIFWKYANSKRKTNTGISELKFKSEEGEERKTTTDKEKAEVLASLFVPSFSVSSPTSMFLFNLLYGFSIQRNVVVFLSFVVGVCIHMWYIFNFPKIDWKNWLTKGDKISENFVESIRDSYMFQHVMENTGPNPGIYLQFLG
jgi:hypothetical protein